MIIRKVAKLLRGKATPAQIILASVLGSMLGFIPGFGRGPGLVVVLVLLLVILNANLFIATIAAFVGKALSVVLMPISFILGRALLDGPTQGGFKAMINAPVLALFGFEYYATTGGLVVGLVVGLGFGAVVSRSITSFRMKMTALEEGSPRFVQLSRTWWARCLIFVLVGRGHGKQTYQQLVQRKIGNPIRPVGVVLALVVVVFFGVMYQFASGPIVTAVLKRGLERANGATVDIGQVDLDLAAGRLTVIDFAMSDPNDLETDLLRARRVEADVSTADLLRKRFAMDRIVFAEASHGQQRRVPGRLVGSPLKLRPPSEDLQIPMPSGKTLQEYFRQAETWKQRLAQVRRWLGRLAGPQDQGTDDPAQKATLRDRLAEQVQRLGYSRTKADHLIEGAPTFVVYELVADKVRTSHLEGETLTIHGENLSTHPYLLAEPPRARIESSGGTLRASIGFAGSEGGANNIAFSYRGLATDTFARQLAVTGAPPIQGGTIDVDAHGRWSQDAGGWIELPMTVTLHHCTLSLAGLEPMTLDELVIPIEVRGPLDDPRITLDDNALADALVDAGASELAKRFQDEVGSVLDKALGDLPGGIGDDAPDLTDAIKKGLGDLLGGRKDKPRNRDP